MRKSKPLENDFRDISCLSTEDLVLWAFFTSSLKWGSIYLAIVLLLLLTPKRAVRNWERVRRNEERVRIRAVPAFAEVKKKIREKMLMLAGRARTSGSVAHKS